MRSERWVNIHGPLDGNGFIFSTFFHSTCPDQNVTEAECMNAFPTNRPAKHQFMTVLRHAYFEMSIQHRAANADFSYSSRF